MRSTHLPRGRDQQGRERMSGSMRCQIFRRVAEGAGEGTGGTRWWCCGRWRIRIGGEMRLNVSSVLVLCEMVQELYFQRYGQRRLGRTEHLDSPIE